MGPGSLMGPNHPMFGGHPGGGGHPGVGGGYGPGPFPRGGRGGPRGGGGRGARYDPIYPFGRGEYVPHMFACTRAYSCIHAFINICKFSIFKCVSLSSFDSSLICFLVVVVFCVSWLMSQQTGSRSLPAAWSVIVVWLKNREFIIRRRVTSLSHPRSRSLLYHIEFSEFKQ